MQKKQKMFDSSIMREDESKATKHSKHFILNNGTRKAVFSPNAINYYDKTDETWKTIDNSLKAVNDDYQANLGKYTAFFSRGSEKELVEVIDGADKISWEYLGNNKNKFTVSENIGAVASEKRKAKSKVKSKIKDMLGLSNSSRVVYSNAEGNVDLDYSVEGNGIKENIIIKAKNSQYRYYFLFRVAGFEMKPTGEGSAIEFFKTASNNTADSPVPEFIMPSPFMYDANGERSDAVKYCVEPVCEGVFVLAIEADEEWVNSTERVFPVCIDPQLLTMGNPHITVTHEQYQWCNGGECNNSGCNDCTCNESNWVHVSSPYYSYVRLYYSDFYKTTAKIHIPKDDFDFSRNRLISAKLVFEPYPGQDYTSVTQLKIGGVYYSYSLNKTITADITNVYKNQNADITVDLSIQSGGGQCKFNLPTLQVEYQPLTDDPVRVPLSLENGANAEYDVLSGDTTVTIDDISDPILGVAVSHIYKPNDEITEYGQNFRLNLNEKLVKTNTTSTGSQYTYTDSNGDLHTFNEYFYRIGIIGEKVYITSDIDKITADADNRLWLNDVEVFRELRSDRGLRASARLEGVVNNAEWVEQRIDDEKKLEEQIKSYQNTLYNFVSVDKYDGEIIDEAADKLGDPDQIEKFLCSDSCSPSKILLSKDEAVSFKSLFAQKQSLLAALESLELQKESLKNSAKSMLLQFKSINTFDYQKKSDEAQSKLLEYERQNYISLYNDYHESDDNSESGREKAAIYRKQFILIGITSDDLSADTRQGMVNHHKDVILDAQETEWFAQKKNILHQISKFPGLNVPTSMTDKDGSVYTVTVDGTLKKQYTNTQSQIAILSHQASDISAQIDLYVEKGTKYISQFKSYYKEYLNMTAQFEKLRAQVPVCYLISDNVIKGFNADGDLVITQDKYGKYVVIECEKYSASGKTRISSVYDQDGKTMTFAYNKDNKLSEICNTLGERVTFNYDRYGYLTEIVRENNPSLTLSYTTVNGIKRISKITSSNNTSASLSYNVTAMLKGITRSTTVKGIAHDNIVTGTNTAVSTLSIEYFESYTKLTYDKFKQDIYMINNNSEKIIAHYELKGGVVTNAERYEYNEYVLNKTSRAGKTCLNRYSFEEFTTRMQVETEENTTYNSFKEPTKVVNYKYALPRTACDNPIEQTTTVYTYNDNHKLVEKKSTHAYRDCCETFNQTVSVEKYYYDNAGELVRKENYVEGEELKNGVTIEEHIFNDKGIEVQSFTYNSLDPSSKFYTENEVDENGKVLSTLDESGKHKTSFEYERDGVNVRSEILPNGSRFSYGRAKDGATVSITHSTENGEENSTAQIRTLDSVTQIKSGNNTVGYEYDGKRRVTSVALNGVEDYVTYEYSGEHTNAETVKATMVGGTEVINTKNAHGNLTKSSCGDRIVENTYNIEQQLTKTVDSVSGETKLDYDAKGNLISVTAPDYTETFAYDEIENTLDSKTVTVGGVERTYYYGYKITSDRAVDSISVDGNVVRPAIDALGRNVGKTIEIGDSKIAEERISYAKFGDRATQMPSTVRFAVGGVFNESIQYRYDSMGNIAEVFENGRSACRYEYDALNRLTREDNVAFGKTTTWAYDNNGNIIARYEYAITTKPTSELHLLDCTCKLYTYADNSDQLMSCNGEIFEYDLIGNPTTYRSKSATWAYGRQLTAFDGNTFSYDARGRRIGKNGITFTYDSNGNLIKQSNGLEFLYDHTGVFAVKYNGSTYFYRKNAQQDIIALLDNTGAVVVKYKYDAWGMCQTTVVASDANAIAELNPFRYRSYYYDTETGFYFLKTRYYDPEIGRFTTIDDLAYLDPETINGLNLYAYCGDNPVKSCDSSGTFALSTFLICLAIGAVVGGILGGVTAYANGQDVFTGVVTGSLLGAAVGAVIGIGGAVLSGALSALAGKVVTDLISVAFYGGSFGTWEDYAIAFAFGGLAGGMGSVIANGGSVASIVAQAGKFAGDVFLRPATNQIVKTATRGNTFNGTKLLYDVITRSATYFGTSHIIKGNLGEHEIKIDLGKNFNRATARYLYNFIG